MDRSAYTKQNGLFTLKNIFFLMPVFILYFHHLSFKNTQQMLKMVAYYLLFWHIYIMLIGFSHILHWS